MSAEIERDWGRPVPAAYFDEMKGLVAEAYRTELRAVPGVAEVLGRLRIPICVASSGAPGKLRLGLEAAGLLRPFGTDLVSTSPVAQGKPAPDIFIYAAGWMRTPIPDCLEIEDSIPGVRAARAAGLRVFGFTGGSHCPPTTPIACSNRAPSGSSGGSASSKPCCPPRSRPPAPGRGDGPGFRPLGEAGGLPVPTGG